MIKFTEDYIIKSVDIGEEVSDSEKQIRWEFEHQKTGDTSSFEEIVKFDGGDLIFRSDDPLFYILDESELFNKENEGEFRINEEDIVKLEGYLIKGVNTDG